METTAKGVVVPQCVNCHKILSNDALRPNRLKRHLESHHPALKDKDVAFFKRKKTELLQMTGKVQTFVKPKIGTVQASFEIAWMISRAKCPHTIGEKLIKPCLLKAADLVAKDEVRKEFSKISLSDSTIKRRIDELGSNLKKQLNDKLKLSPSFAIQLDETTDVAKLSQLLCYVRFVGTDKVEEEILFCKPMTTTTTSSDVHEILQQFFEENSLDWDKLVGICTDGAPVMLGCRSGLVTKVKDAAKNAVSTHCVIHREALASRILSAEFMETLAVAKKVVKFIKGNDCNTRLFHEMCRDMESDHQQLLYDTEIRWLSSGNMLARVYELRSEIKQFLELKGKVELCSAFNDTDFELRLSFLVDIFGELNKLNKTLQGRNTNRMKDYDAVSAFMAKLKLWSRRIAAGVAASFATLDCALANNQVEFNGSLKSDVQSSLQLLHDEFLLYYPDIKDRDLPEWRMTRNPFFVDPDTVPLSIQEELIDLTSNSNARDDHEQMSIESFWVKYAQSYRAVGGVALKILLPFSSTYLCESGFSSLVFIKNKYRNRLDCESDMICALSAIEPQFEYLARSKQTHSSH